MPPPQLMSQRTENDASGVPRPCCSMLRTKSYFASQHDAKEVTRSRARRWTSRRVYGERHGFRHVVIRRCALVHVPRREGLTIDGERRHPRSRRHGQLKPLGRMGSQSHVGPMLTTGACAPAGFSLHAVYYTAVSVHTTKSTGRADAQRDVS